MNTNELVHALQLSIAPATLISGVALLTLSATNRMAHLIDRVRALHAQQASATPAEPLRQQLQVLIRRAQIQRMTVLAFLSSMLAASLVVVLLFLSQMLEFTTTTPVAILFILNVTFLIAGLSGLFLDVSLNLRALLLETGWTATN